jgi:1-aminocyclopropane-1-carboxylate deaminase/D-cysteine desulfhydrase-like pyridoxal-dependent ACC family enzyme
MAEALSCSAEVIVTCGAAQSNFIRQLGAACAIFGIRCMAVVMDLPYELEPPKGIRLDTHVGNPALGKLTGVETIHLEDATWEVLFSRTFQEATRLRSQGKKVYEIPIGGSSPLGAYAFYKAAEEVIGTGHTFDWIVFGSSSGSTQTGLTYGFQGTSTRVLGIAADPEPDFADDMIELGVGLAQLLERPALGKESYHLNLGYCGGGYGVTDEKTLAAVREFATREGIFLDPIYSGKAFLGLQTIAQTGQLQGKVLFWHTGGFPTLFALPA